MKRYEKFVLEAGKGITFEVSEGTSGELIIRALNIATANVSSTNYVNPPIPDAATRYLLLSFVKTMGPSKYIHSENSYFPL